MLHAGIEALFGRNRDGHRTRHILQLRQHHQKQSQQIVDEQEQLAKFFSNKPHLNKELFHQSSFAFGSMQGWRSSMEDTQTFLSPLDNHRWKLWSLFSIFDGHHGISTAKHAANQLSNHLLTSLNHMLRQQEENDAPVETPIHSSKVDSHRLQTAIREAYFQLDKDLREVVRDDSGCVCISCLMDSENIYLINIGDSRAIIFSKDGKVLAHTEDHTPNDPHEKERIHEAGGKISKAFPDDVLRVNSQLAMTRVLGDFGMNKNVVPALADIIEYPRDGSASFIILACDGIWDVMSNEEVAKFVTSRISKTNLEDIVSELIDECYDKESSDNMSVFLIQL